MTSLARHVDYYTAVEVGIIIGQPDSMVRKRVRERWHDIDFIRIRRSIIFPKRRFWEWALGVEGIEEFERIADYRNERKWAVAYLFGGREPC